MKHAPVEISLTDIDNNPQFVLWNDCHKAAKKLHAQCEELEAEIERLREVLKEADEWLRRARQINPAVMSAHAAIRAALTEDKP
jgi:prefoldin subunit 5